MVDVAALLPLMPALSVRLKRMPEAVELLRFLYQPQPFDTPVTELHNDNRLPLPNALSGFSQVLELVQTIPSFDVDSLREGINAIGEQVSLNGRAGPMLGIMRLAVTGQKVSPPMFESMVALGRERVVSRLSAALALLRAESIRPLHDASLA